ncbi:hypothetical protein DFH07DRAFT_807857 [Mycena maculata]|uniref:Uncharacterized protein n=1 Tax=Mycena maculata TaxID=230809 RepID=A0AAD7JRP1_9AGAR|nr:hypothetical protein DFH07DRAFT_807857 [Mycena maculata]
MQRHIRKLEVMYMNNIFDEHLEALGLPKPKPVVVIAAETETPEEMAAVFRDLQFLELLKEGDKFGFRSDCCVFSADVTKKIDKPTGNDTVRVMCVFKIPPGLLNEEFQQKVEGFVERNVDHPANRNNLLEYTIWRQTETMDGEISASGYPPSDPTFVLFLEADNWDRIIQIAQDPEIQKMGAEARQQFGPATDSSCFGANIVTKLDKH